MIPGYHTNRLSINLTINKIEGLTSVIDMCLHQGYSAIDRIQTWRKWNDSEFEESNELCNCPAPYSKTEETSIMQWGGNTTFNGNLVTALKSTHTPMTWQMGRYAYSTVFINTFKGAQHWLLRLLKHS